MEYLKPDLLVLVSALKAIESGQKFPQIVIEAYVGSPFLSSGAYEADEWSRADELSFA